MRVPCTSIKVNIFVNVTMVGVSIVGVTVVCVTVVGVTVVCVMIAGFLVVKTDSICRNQTSGLPCQNCGNLTVVAFTGAAGCKPCRAAARAWMPAASKGMLFEILTSGSPL